MYSFSIACRAQEIPKVIKKIIQFQIAEKTINKENDKELEELKNYLNKYDL